MAFRPSARTSILTPAPNAFWAARLLERREAERALRDDYTDLRECIDHQKAQLDAIQERLERETAERARVEEALHKAQKDLDRLIGDGAPAGASPGAPAESRGATTDTLGKQYGALKQRAEQLQAGLQTIADALQHERTERTQAHSALERAQADLAARVGKGTPPAGGPSLFERKQAESALRRDYVELWERLGNQSGELRALRDALEREIKERQRTEQTLLQVRGALEGRNGRPTPPAGEGNGADTRPRAEDELRERVSQQASAIAVIRDALQRESAERTRADEAMHGAHAALRQQLDAHAKAASATQLAQGRHTQKTLHETQGELRKQVARHGAELQGIREALLQGAAERGALQRAHADLKRRVNRRATRQPNMSVIARVMEGRRAARALRRGQGELHKRLGEQEAELRRIRKALECETAERTRTEAAFSKVQVDWSQRLEQRDRNLDARLDARMTERRRAEEGLQQRSSELCKRLDQQAAELQAIREMLERETAQRARSESGLQQAILSSRSKASEVSKEAAELRRGIEEQAEELRTLRKAVERERAERASAEGARHMLEQALSQRITEEVGDALASVREGTPAVPVDADARRRIEEQREELQAIRDELQREAVARQRAEAAFRAAEERLETRIAGQHEKLRTIRSRLRRAFLERRMAALAPSAEVPQDDQAARAQLAEIRRDVRIEVDRILGMSGLALDTELSSVQRGYLRTVTTAAGTALRVLRQGRRGGGAAQGRDLETAPFSIRDTLRITLEPLATRARRKGTQVAYHVAPEVPDALKGNASGLQHLLVNLVGNAIKNTTAGEIVVSVGVTSQAQSDAVLLFGITDTGGELPADTEQQIFEALNSDRYLAMRRTTPMGLSLAIAGRLARSMGGRIWVETDPNQGTTFRFTLRLGLQKRDAPYPRAGQSPESWATPEPSEMREASGNPLRVLLADANPQSRSALARLLQADGHDVLVVEDGRQAMAALEDGRFDVVLMELRMPRMDAFEAAAAIRARETPNEGHLSIVGLAAQRTPGDQERCQAVGIDAWIATPVEPAELYAAVRESIERRRRHARA